MVTDVERSGVVNARVGERIAHECVISEIFPGPGRDGTVAYRAEQRAPAQVPAARERTPSPPILSPPAVAAIPRDVTPPHAPEPARKRRRRGRGRIENLAMHDIAYTRTPVPRAAGTRTARARPESADTLAAGRHGWMGERCRRGGTRRRGDGR